MGTRLPVNTGAPPSTSGSIVTAPSSVVLVSMLAFILRRTGGEGDGAEDVGAVLVPRGWGGRRGSDLRRPGRSLAGSFTLFVGGSRRASWPAPSWCWPAA